MPLTDIVCCDAADLHSAITSEEPYAIGTWYMAKRIGTIELCKLGEILGIGTYDEIKSGFGLVGEPLPEGPWPETIHEGLLSAIREIEDSRISDVTPKWAKIDEFWGGADPNDLAQYLKEVRAFLTKNAGTFFLVNPLWVNANPPTEANKAPETTRIGVSSVCHASWLRVSQLWP